MTLSNAERQAIVNYRMERAFETLKEVSFVAEGGFWNLAANRLYYSAFYACIALLSANRLDPTSHAGVARMINLHFVRPGILSQDEGKLLKRLFRMRQTGDYDDLSDWEREDVMPLIPLTLKLVEHISSLVAIKFE